MSDDHLLGTSCHCVPRRSFVLFVAAIFWLSGFFEIIGWILFAHIRESSIPVSDCVGTRCLKVFTCGGLEESTMDLRHVFNVIGGAIFGWFGFFGALNRDPEHLKKYAAFLVASVFVYIFIFIFDSVFVASCDLYNTNIMTQTLLWPVPFLPMSERRKKVVTEMAHYPVSTMDQFIEGSVYWRYVAVVLFVIVVTAYVANETMKLVSMYIEGPCGTGANYTLEALHERALLRAQMKKAYMATIASGQDAGEPAGIEGGKIARV